jgi:hypothetical protein
MGSKVNNNSTVAKCTQRKAAAKQYIPGAGTILVHAKQYNEQQVEAVYQACIDARAKLVTLRGQVTAAMAAKKEVDATMKDFDAGLKDWVSTTFGPKSQAAIDFGYAKKQPAKQNVDEKAQARAKAKATRQARGTKGPKQRKKITGASVQAQQAMPANPANPATPTTPANKS